MEYNNGIFLILEPGYYRIVAHLKSDDHRLEYFIVKNSRENLIYTRLEIGAVTSTHYIADLAQFDMVSIELRYTATVGHAGNSNAIQIEKIN